LNNPIKIIFKESLLSEDNLSQLEKEKSNYLQIEIENEK